MDKYLKILEKLNTKAKNNGDIPISALIIKDNLIISKDYNRKVKNNNPFDHAEILAIKKACKKLDTYNLNDCILISTLKPCKMCMEVIKECRIKKVYYYADNTKDINDTTKYIKIENVDNKFGEEISDFFKIKR